MRKSSFAFIIVALFSTSGFSQADTYYTKHAKLKLHGEFNNKPVTLHTEKLAIMLDYETTQLIIRFDLNSLKSDSDSLNQLLKNNPDKVVFDGKLGLEYINTNSHPPLYFNFEGWLTSDNVRKLMTGKGELHHISNTDQVACMLGLVMDLNFDDLDIELPLVDLKKDFKAVVTEAVLRRDKN